jgi:hypothetical protein
MTTNKMKLFLLCLFPVCSTCLGRLFRPSSGAHNSFNYCPPILPLAGIVDDLEMFQLIHDTRNIGGQYLKL